MAAIWRIGSAPLIWIFLFSAFVNILSLTAPLFILQVYDRVLSSQSVPTLVALLAIVMVVLAVYAVLETSRRQLASRLAARVQLQFDRSSFRNLMRDKGGFMPRDVGAVRKVFSSPALFALFDLIWLPVFLGVIFVFHSLMGQLALIGVVVLISLNLLNRWVMQMQSARIVEPENAAQAIAGYTSSNRDELSALRLEPDLAARWSAARVDALAKGSAFDAVLAWIASVSVVARQILVVLTVSLGAWLLIANEITIGGMVASSILLGRVLMPLEQMIQHWPVLKEGFEAASRLSMDGSANAGSPLHIGNAPPASGLSVDKLSVFRAGHPKPSLSGVGFHVAPGCAIGVIGESGFGKTTLVHCIVGVVQPQVGSIRLNGFEIAAQLHSGSRQIGYLPQSLVMPGGSLAEVVGGNSPDQPKLDKAADIAGIAAIVASLPGGWSYTVGHGGEGLSGGQRQRIALARAVYGDPAVLVLDEPNSQLDAAGQLALSHAVSRFKDAGGIVVLTAHRPSGIAACDQILFLEQGRVRALGPRDEVLKAHTANHAQILSVMNGGARGPE